MVLNYDFLKELYIDKGLSQRAIAKELGVSRDKIRYWLRKYRISPNEDRRIHVVPKLTISKELAYILGVFMGDGWVSDNHHGNFAFNVATINKVFAEKIYKSLKGIGVHPSIYVLKPRITPITKGCNVKPLFKVVASSKILYDWLKSLKVKDIEDILQNNPHLVSYFLGGFFDSEGCYREYQRTEKYCEWILEVGCTNKELMSLIQRLLNRYGVILPMHCKRTRTLKEYYYLRTSDKRTIKRIKEIVPSFRFGGMSTEYGVAV
jgi:DNA-binding transcriptional regulator WhiA